MEALFWSLRVAEIQQAREQVAYQKLQGETVVNPSKYCHTFRRITCVNQINVYL
jgi:hypothetical protein